MVSPHSHLNKVTQRVIERSKPTRTAYLARIDGAQGHFPARGALSCANLAHGFAGMEGQEKISIKAIREPNIGIVSSYNEMLSAHAPFKNYPDIIKHAARQAGGVAQFAGGVPAMCDGVTQGNAGMELSLVLARSDCHEHGGRADPQYVRRRVVSRHLRQDRARPADRRAAIRPSCRPSSCRLVPMTSGLTNDDKAKVRQQFATGACDRDALLEAEAAAYHGHGTCTFYGTANSNQMLMEVMGLHLPGSAFIHPHTPLKGRAHRRSREARARTHRGAWPLHAGRPCGR